MTAPARVIKLGSIEFDRLLRDVYSVDITACASAVDALSSALSQQDPASLNPMIDAIIGEGIVTRLLEYANFQCLQVPTLRLLAYMVSGDASHIKILVEHDTVNVLLSVLQISNTTQSDERVYVLACFIIGTIAGVMAANMPGQTFVDINGIQILIDLLQTHYSESLQITINWTLRQLTMTMDDVLANTSHEDVRRIRSMTLDWMCV